MQTTLSGNTSRKPYLVVGRGKWRRGNRKMVTEEVFHLTFPLDKTSSSKIYSGPSHSCGRSVLTKD